MIGRLSRADDEGYDFCPLDWFASRRKTWLNVSPPRGMNLNIMLANYNLIDHHKLYQKSKYAQTNKWVSEIRAMNRRISHILSVGENSLNYAVETLTKDSLFSHFGQFIRGWQLEDDSCDKFGRITVRFRHVKQRARPLSFSLHPKLTCTLFSRARSRHSRRRAFAVTRNVPKRRANETVRNWFNEVGRSRRCARDEQCELQKRGRTSERGSKRRRWKKQKSRRRREETTAKAESRGARERRFKGKKEEAADGKGTRQENEEEKRREERERAREIQLEGRKEPWRTGRSLRSSAGSSAATGRGDLDVATRGGGASRKSESIREPITVPRQRLVLVALSARIPTPSRKLLRERCFAAAWNAFGSDATALCLGYTTAERYCVRSEKWSPCKFASRHELCNVFLQKL